MSKSQSDCKVTISESDCKVTMSESECKVAMSESECKVTMSESECKVTMSESDFKVTMSESESDCKVTMSESDCKVTMSESESDCKVTISESESDCKVTMSESDCKDAMSESDCKDAMPESDCKVTMSESKFDCKVTMSESDCKVTMSESESDCKVTMSESDCKDAMSESDCKVTMSESESDCTVKMFVSEFNFEKWGTRPEQQDPEDERLESLQLEVAVRELKDESCNSIVRLFKNAGQRDVAVKAAVEHARWNILAKVLEQHYFPYGMGKCPLARWAVEEASKGCNELENSLPHDYWERDNQPLIRILNLADPDQYPALLDELSSRRKWFSVHHVLQKCRKCVSPEQVNRVMDRACDEPNEDALRSVSYYCPPDYRCRLMFKAVRKNYWNVVRQLMNTELTRGFFLHSLLEAALLEATKQSGNTTAEHVGKSLSSNSVFEEISEIVLSFIRAHAKRNKKVKKDEIIAYFFGSTALPQNYEEEDLDIKVFVQHVSNVIESAHASWNEYISIDSLEIFLMRYLEGPRDDDFLLQTSFWLPWLGGAIQNKALKELIVYANPRGDTALLCSNISSDKWDNLQFVCLTHVWEQVRRELFEAALEQGHWDLVRLWSDHSVYDDQRLWALDQAYKHQQWGVMLRLADHGLSEVERMRVINRLGKFADWDTTLEMFEHGVDIVEMRGMLKAAMKRRKEEKNHLQYAKRCESLKYLQPRIFCVSESFRNLLSKSKWRAVLHRLRKRPNNKRFMKTLEQAIAECAWHVVIQVIRLGITAGQRDSLVTRMLEIKQWEVVRELLEQGVSVQLCKDMLPELLQKKQWVLVAKIMNYDETDEQIMMITDDMRRQIMETALESQEGSLVWHCISTMKSEVSEEDRIRIFETAFKDNNWQAVKVAVEREADPRHVHRTKALLEAIKQHRWDVVDHCMLFKADVDRDTLSVYEETAMHRAARQKDWRAVEELVCRGADTLLEDRNGYRVMDKALKSKQPSAPQSTLKTLIEFHAPLCEPNKHDKTPLQIFIERQYGELIDIAILWCPDLHKGITFFGETALHAVCASGCWQAMRWLIARGVHPFQLSLTRKSEMAFCLRNGDRSQRMLAECIKLGLSTYQRIVSDLCFCNRSSGYEPYPEVSSDRVSRLLGGDWSSPLEYVLSQGKRVLLEMLYESGACSNKELFEVYRDIPSVRGYHPRYLEDRRTGEDDEIHKFTLNKMLPIVQQMATTPRTLKSSCRLVISHCLSILKRHWEVKSLTKLDQDMQDYVMFTDLTDPNYGKELISWDEELVQEMQSFETDLERTNAMWSTVIVDDNVSLGRYSPTYQYYESSRSGSPYSEYDFSDEFN